MISEFDVEELVRGIGGLDDEEDVYDYVFETFDIEWDNFVRMIDILMPLIVVGQSPLTQKVYRGFGKDNMFFIKQEVEGHE